MVRGILKTLTIRPSCVAYVELCESNTNIAFLQIPNEYHKVFHDTKCCVLFTVSILLKGPIFCRYLRLYLQFRLICE